LLKTAAKEVIGADAGGLSQLAIWLRWAVRAAPGCGPKMIFSFSGVARIGCATPEKEKRETEWGGVLPGAAASAALPRAGVRLPFQGAGKAYPA